MHSSEKPSKSWTNSSRVCRNTHRRHFENGSRRHQRDRGCWCFHSVAIFDSTYSVPLLSTFQQENLRVLTSVKDFETWKSCTLDLGPFKEVLGHSDRSQEVRRKPSGVSKRLRYVSKFLDVARWVWYSLVLWKPCRRKQGERHQCWGFSSLLSPQLRQHAALTSKSKTARAFSSTDSKDLEGKLFFRSVDLHTQTLVFFMHLNYSQLDYFAHGWQNVQYGIPSFEVI